MCGSSIASQVMARMCFEKTKLFLCLIFKVNTYLRANIALNFIHGVCCLLWAIMFKFTSDNIAPSIAVLCIQGQCKQNSEEGSSPLGPVAVSPYLKPDLVTIMLYRHLCLDAEMLNSEIPLSRCCRVLPYNRSWKNGCITLFWCFSKL